jgi:hypothetical protein
MIWTPYVIGLVLHHHVSPAPFEYHHAPAYPEAIERLIREGILVSNGETFETTELGQALVKLWCSTPIPVAKYVDPRFVTSEGE